MWGLRFGEGFQGKGTPHFKAPKPKVVRALSPLRTASIRSRQQVEWRRPRSDVSRPRIHEAGGLAAAG
jgi:hypothetical protein